MQLITTASGPIEVRWSWLPFWVAVSPKTQEIAEEMMCVSLVNGLTSSDDDMKALEAFVLRRICEVFDNPDLTRYMNIVFGGS